MLKIISSLFPVVLVLVFLSLAWLDRKRSTRTKIILIVCAIISLLFVPFLGFFLILPPVFGKVINGADKTPAQGVSVIRYVTMSMGTLGGEVQVFKKDFITTSKKDGIFFFGPRILISNPCVFGIICPYLDKDLIRPQDNHQYLVKEDNLGPSSSLVYYPIHKPNVSNRNMLFMNFSASQFINTLEVFPKINDLSKCSGNSSCIELNSFRIAVINRDLGLCSTLESVAKKYCNELITYQEVDANAIKSTEGWNKWLNEVGKVQGYNYCENIPNETNHIVCEQIIIDGRRLIEHTKMLDTLHGTSYGPAGVCGMQIVCLNEKTGQYDQCPDKLKIAKQEGLEELKKRWPEFANEIVCNK